MSLLNAWALPGKAIVAVDSDGVGQDGSRMPASKLLPIPHLNAVMGLRGQLAFFGLLFMRAITSSLDSFDALDDAMPRLLADTEDLCQRKVQVHGCAVGNELVIAGWSDREKSMLVRLFYRRDNMPAFMARDVDDFFVSPWHASMPEIPKKAHLAVKIARAQVGWMRDSYPDAACGGRMILCELTRSEMTMSHGVRFQAQEDGHMMAAAIQQDAHLGIYGDFLLGESSRFGRSVLETLAGPVPATIADLDELRAKLINGDPIASEAFRQIVNNTPFANLFYARIALDYLVIYRIQEAMNPGYLRRLERRIERENSQDFWLRPTEIAR